MLFHHSNTIDLHVSGIFFIKKKKSSCNIYIDLSNIFIRDKQQVLDQIAEEASLKSHDTFSSKAENKTDTF